MAFVLPAIVFADDDTTEIKQGFIRACGEHLRVVDDAVLQGKGDDVGQQKFWVVRVQPNEPGFYTVIHDLGKAVPFGMYDRCKHAYQFKVAPAGTQRMVGMAGRAKPDACVGDRLDLVFEFSPRFGDANWTLNFSDANDEERLRKIAAKLVEEGGASGYSIRSGQFPEHELVQVMADADELEAASVRAITNVPRVFNQASNILQCLETKARGAATITGRQLPYVAMTFQAVAPAKINLRISLPDGTRNSVVVPIVVVSNGAPLAIIVKNVGEHWYNLKDQNSSSGSWHAVEEESVPCQLRVGDIVRTQAGGRWDSLTPIRCEAEPFMPRKAGIFDQDSFRRLKRDVQADTWREGQKIYRDRNHDGRIDWQVSGELWRSDGADVYKVDTNYDGFYDLEYSFGYGIAGKPTTNGLHTIHEPVRVVAKDFLPIEKPSWIE